MPRLSELLDELGPPPAEICVEWIWQLHEAVEGRLNQALHWSELEAADEGRKLTIVSPTCAAPVTGERTCAGDLISQLVSWSGQVARCGSDSHAEDRPVAAIDEHRQLIECTLHLAAARSTPSQPAETASTAPASHLEKSSRTRGGKRNHSKRRHPQVLHTAQSRTDTSLPRRLLFSRARVVGLVGCVLFGMHGLSRFKGAEKFTDGTAGAEAQFIARSSRAHDSLTPHARQVVEQTDPISSPQVSQPVAAAAIEPVTLATTDGLGQTESSGQAGYPNLSDLVMADGVEDQMEQIYTRLAPDALTSTLGDEPQATELHSSGQVEEPLDAALDDRDISAAPKKIDLSDLDPLAVVERVRQEAEQESIESDVSLTDAEATDAPPPLVLETFPMQQVQTLNDKFEGRVRKPSWSIRLEAGEGLVVSPSVAQQLASGQAVSWLIKSSDAVAPATQVVVQAQLQSSRSVALRWRVFAGAEDFPQFLVPLEKRYMDEMQIALGESAQRMRLAVEQLRAMARQPGVSGELRSALKVQRQGLQLQLDVSQRALAIVADANQLEGWLDGQVRVHAHLFDSALSDVEPVLQFGRLATGAEANGPDETAGKATKVDNSMEESMEETATAMDQRRD